MLNPMHDKKEGTYRGGEEGKTPVTCCVAQNLAEGKHVLLVELESKK